MERPQRMYLISPARILLAALIAALAWLAFDVMAAPSSASAVTLRSSSPASTDDSLLGGILSATAPAIDTVDGHVDTVTGLVSAPDPVREAVQVTEVLDAVDPTVTEVVAAVPVVEAVVKPLVTEVVAPVAQPVIAPVVDQAVAPVLDTVVTPVVEDVVAPVAGAVVTPVVDEVVAPIIDGIATPIVDNSVTPVVDGIVSPVVDGLAAPVVDAVVTPIIDAVVPPVTGPVVVPGVDAPAAPGAGSEVDTATSSGPAVKPVPVDADLSAEPAAATSMTTSSTVSAGAPSHRVAVPTSALNVPSATIAAAVPATVAIPTLAGSSEPSAPLAPFGSPLSPAALPAPAGGAIGSSGTGNGPLQATTTPFGLLPAPEVRFSSSLVSSDELPLTPSFDPGSTPD